MWWLAEGKDAGLAQVQALACGKGEGGHGRPEGTHGILRASPKEGHAVVCVMRSTNAVPCYTEPHRWAGPEPAV